MEVLEHLKQIMSSHPNQNSKGIKCFNCSNFYYGLVPKNYAFMQNFRKNINFGAHLSLISQKSHRIIYNFVHSFTFGHKPTMIKIHAYIKQNIDLRTYRVHHLHHRLQSWQNMFGKVVFAHRLCYL